MSRSLRRGALAAVLAVTIAPLAAACGTGDDPQTLEVKPDSVATTVGDVQIQNAFIVTEPKGTGAAAITARVFNNSTSAQRLTAIAVQGVRGPVTLTAADGKTGPLTIPAGGAVTLGGKGNPSAVMADSTGVSLGGFQNTVFEFSGTGEVSIAPSVVPAVQYFSAYGPGVQATPSPTGPGASTSGAPSANPSGSVSPSGSGSPSAPGGTPGKATGSQAPVASGTPKA